MVSPVFEACAQFLRAIGIPVTICPGVRGFLRHVRMDAGGLLIDPISDAVCGTMLHEAGHIAITPSPFRPFLTGDADSVAPMMDAYLASHPDAFTAQGEDPIARGILQAGETEAIAWSYAAAFEIGVDTTLPFQLGFDGDGMTVHTMIAAGGHYGINGLAAGGMTKLRGADCFPKMRRWLQV